MNIGSKNLESLEQNRVKRLSGWNPNEVAWWERGRPPKGYAQLDLTDPEQLALAILKTVSTQ